METEPILPSTGHFGHLQRITNNHRFITYRGTHDSMPVFIKVAAEPRLRERFEIEAEGIRMLARMDPDSKLYRVPQLVELNSEYIATEWMDGVPMSAAFENGDTKRVRADIAYLVELFAFFDTFPGAAGVTRFNQPGMQSGAGQAIEKLQDLHAEHVIDMELAQKVASYIESVAPATETRYQHGDLQPGNILATDNSVSTIVDFETCSPLWPRHYNIVNFVFNYQLKYSEYEDEIAQSFWTYCNKTKVNPADNVDAFNISAAMRGL